MSSPFWTAFGDWYLFNIDALLLIGTYYFLKLKKEEKANSYYWLPFLIIAFTVFYENLGAYTNYNFEFKKSVNALLGNTEFPKYNLWLYNIANKQLSTVLYLFLIKTWLEPSQKKYINWMVIVFVIVSIFLQIAGIEPLYLNQPIIFSMGANMILVGSGLYFIGLITNQYYLNTNPLKLLSFWQMTFLLFTYSLTYINSMTVIYLYEINPQLGISIVQIDRVLGILNKVTLVLIITSPLLKKVFVKEPIFGVA
ncbi:histidine kinase [Algoriphagus lutimaris]|uniref:histidine kinase n=1 Tax=Algoriphagus lutimaris TaxID=613197 RepID=UPI00196BABAB|nr:histidine kinase [Algoriphagus lutimaris]MBN3520803.1 histidine kinase [Algoriphagus lutimaris]